MLKKNRLPIIIFISLLITFFFNCKYFFVGTENSVGSWLAHHISTKYTLFSFLNEYLDTYYHGVILWDNLFLYFGISWIISLFLYKYISKIFYIKISEKIKKEDKVFLVVFFLLLIIPFSRFDHRDTSNMENRTLAKMPELLKDGEAQFSSMTFANINFNYLKDLEKYINDRFFTRNLLICLYKDIVYNTAIRYPHINRRYIDKKTKWLGRYYSPPIYHKKLSKGQYNKFVKEINSGLNDFNKYCISNNIKLFVLINPEKVSIYKPALLKTNDDEDVKKFLKEINSNQEINIIFPMNELQKEANSKATLLYYKTDHHLTNSGYYLVYELLMHKVKKYFAHIKIVKKSEYDIEQNNYVKSGFTGNYLLGSQCGDLTPNSCPYHLDYLYNYYNHKNKSQLEEENIRESYLLLQKLKYADGNPQKVLMMGNSHIEGLLNFIAYSFKEVYKLRLNGPSGIPRSEQYKILKYYDQIIKEYKPNIIILVIDYDNIKELGKIAKYD